MDFPRRAWLLGVLPALALACQLVDPESDLQDLEVTDAAAPDASLAADAASGADASAPETGADAAADVDADADAALCANIDAVICDDFNNRAELVPDGGPNWAYEVQSGTMNEGFQFYEGSFNARLPTGNTPATVYLQSVPLKTASGWILDFDLTGSVSLVGAPSYLTIAELDFSYDASTPGALTAQSFQLLVGTDDSAKLLVFQTQAGKDAGAPLTVLDTADAHGLLAAPQATCHIHLEVYLRGVQTSSGYSICDGQGKEYLDAKNPMYLIQSDGGAGLLRLGYQDPGGVFPVSTYLDYDNVTLVTK